jgi:hypothetical protein
MSKAKQQERSEPRREKRRAGKTLQKVPGARPAVKVSLPKEPRSNKGRKARSGGKLTSRPTVVPRDDANLEGLAGIPDDAQIAETAGLLSLPDQNAFRRVRELLAEHLGSSAAARLWLVTPSPGFVTTPLDAVRQGQATLVLAMLETQWGPSPTHA